MTPEPRFKRLGREVSNHGRWGDDDELGTINLLTPERVVQAARLVRTGQVFPLGIPVDHMQGVQRSPNIMQRVNPIHLMGHIPGDLPLGDGTVVSDDWLIMPTHGASHWDGLAHTGYDGELYNGVPASEVRAQQGAARLGIEKIAAVGIVGRGVLLDMARLFGVASLEAGHAIGPADLERAEAEQGVRVGPGDIIVLRTGWWERFAREGDVDAYRGGQPGLGQDCAVWLRERDVAAIAGDNWGVEVHPVQEGDSVMPLHCVLLRDMGMTIGENFDPGALAEACAADGVYEFLFCSAPLHITNGVGSPSNPLAIR